VTRSQVLFGLHVLAQDLLLLGGAATMPCLGAVHRFALGQQIDQSLLRHFTAQVRPVSNPMSREPVCFDSADHDGRCDLRSCIHPPSVHL
jgi:hypothetical protein